MPGSALLAGDALASSGDIGAAIVHYSDALRLAPLELPVHQRLCHALALLERHSEAIACASVALRLGDGDEFFHSLLGEVYSSAGRHERAAKSYAKACALKPGDAGAHHNEGVAWRTAGRPDKASAAFQRAVQLTPRSAAAYTELAATQARRPPHAPRRPPRAPLPPFFPTPHLALPTCRPQELTLLSSSVHARAMAAELDPTSASAKLDLGHALQAAGRAAEAYSGLAFTRYCHCQYCMVYGIQRGSRGGRRISRSSREIVVQPCG